MNKHLSQDFTVTERSVSTTIFDRDIKDYVQVVYLFRKLVNRGFNLVTTVKYICREVIQNESSIKKHSFSRSLVTYGASIIIWINLPSAFFAI